MPTIQAIYSKIVKEFYDHNITCPEVDAEWILIDTLCLKKSDFILNNLNQICPKKVEVIQSHVKRHINGEPVQYITGSTEFYNTTILVGPGVLIPRPETERLVDIALELYKNKDESILDLCTGSGCILFALAKELPKTKQFIGIDISKSALIWAEKNLHHNSATSEHLDISFILGNLFSPLRNDAKYALITANPPYVSEAEFTQLPTTVKDYEPRQALFANFGGLMILKEIAENACNYLDVNGWLVCEIGENQGKSAINIFTRSGLKKVKIFKDYTSKDRIIIGQNSG